MVRVGESMGLRLRQRRRFQVPIFVMGLLACGAIMACLLTSSLDSLGGGSGPSGGNAGSTAGSGAAAGEAGSGGCGDAGTCGPLEECGTAGATPLCIAKMVAVDVQEGGTYFIGATEVTASQYKSWLATNPSLLALPIACRLDSDGGAGKTTFHSGVGEGNDPITMVDWCDSYGYCNGIGKRLCGRIGGGSNAYADWENTGLSQWFNACSSGGTNTYPYGDVYQDQWCNGSDHMSAAAVPVGSMPACKVTGYTEIYDLSGNVREWEDACELDAGRPKCPTRGGAFNEDSVRLQCRDGNAATRDELDNTIGLRCCAP
jgi:formylglycine-generating enzyme